MTLEKRVADKLMRPVKVTEESKVHEEWYKEANEQTLETLKSFVDHLSSDYEHDYGTIVHAMTAAAIAAAKVVDRGPQGGITGFQAGAIMWEFIKRWTRKDGPMRLVQFKGMLFPQHEAQFSTRMSKASWEWLQKEAARLIETSGKSANQSAVAHWQTIVDGKVPFGWTVEEEKP